VAKAKEAKRRRHRVKQQATNAGSGIRSAASNERDMRGISASGKWPEILAALAWRQCSRREDVSIGVAGGSIVA